MQSKSQSAGMRKDCTQGNTIWSLAASDVPAHLRRTKLRRGEGDLPLAQAPASAKLSSNGSRTCR